MGTLSLPKKNSVAAPKNSGRKPAKQQQTQSRRQKPSPASEQTQRQAQTPAPAQREPQAKTLTNRPLSTSTAVALKGFAVCPSGLEDVLTTELTGLPGFTQVVKGRGGAGFVATPDAIARANLWARIPTRILIEAASGTFRKPEDIRVITTGIRWDQWFNCRQTLRIDLAVGREPKLDAPLARNYATLLIKDGICDQLRQTQGDRPSIDTAHPDIRVWAFIDQNTLTVYLDSSGEPLFKRGWRLAKGEAPLRENLAAALIAMTEWDGKSPLMDPFCGSGTLLIEAMQRALGLPPGYVAQSPRSFAAERFSADSPMGRVDWRELRQEARAVIDRVSDAMAKNIASPGSGISPPPMQGSDRDGRMIPVAQGNAERALPALAANAIQWRTGAFSETTPIAPNGLLVANPPYGKRLEKNAAPDTTDPAAALSLADQEMARPNDHGFERGLAESLKKHFAGWQAWLLTDDIRLENSMRLKAARRIPVFNGDIECRWMRFDMVAGSMREKS